MFKRSWSVLKNAQFVQMMLLWCPLMFYGKVKFAPMFICKEIAWTVDFSETIVYQRMAFVAFSEINETIKQFAYKRLRSSIHILGKKLNKNK